MTRTSQLLCVFYALVAITALYGTMSENLQYASTFPQFLTQFPSILPQFLTDMKANPASRSISIDISLFLLAAAALMVREARRIGVRFVWAYIVFAYLIAASVTFPLFLIAREIRMASPLPAGPLSRLTTTLDVIGLAIVTAILTGLAVWLH
jgi:Terpene cyclase DEP1